jgi:hypothetical protein
MSLVNRLLVLIALLWQLFKKVELEGDVGIINFFTVVQ